MLWCVLIMDIKLDGLFEALIVFGVVFGLSVWGIWELIDWLWIDDAIRVSSPIRPELEIVVKDNVVDTIYVYRRP